MNINKLIVILNSKEFYDVMQLYRHCPETNQKLTSERFGDVKQFIINSFRDNPGRIECNSAVKDKNGKYQCRLHVVNNTCQPLSDEICDNCLKYKALNLR